MLTYIESMSSGSPVPFAAEGTPGRLRMINDTGVGGADRLSDDLAWLSTRSRPTTRSLDEAGRRCGRLSGADDVLTAAVVDPTAAEPSTFALRETARQVREDDRLVSVLLPLGDGLLAAVKSS